MQIIERSHNGFVVPAEAEGWRRAQAIDHFVAASEREEHGRRALRHRVDMISALLYYNETSVTVLIGNLSYLQCQVGIVGGTEHQAGKRITPMGIESS